MKIANFSTLKFERDYLTQANEKFQFELEFLEISLSAQTAELARNYRAITCFVNDQVDKSVIDLLSQGSTELIITRSAGFNHINVDYARKKNIAVARVPDYSPYAVAEFAVTLILALNRKIHRAYNRTREHNFSLDGLMGFDLHGKTVGIIGTGKIGCVFAEIMRGFGCEVIAYDPYENEAFKKTGGKYVDLNALYAHSDIISLHCPLNAATHHLINAKALDKMKSGVMLINTGRGAIMDSVALIQSLKSGKIGYLGLDVYEEEHLFFHDVSNEIIQDDVLTRLQTFPNVLITGHQAFFTVEAVKNIAETTLKNIRAFFTQKDQCHLI